MLAIPLKTTTRIDLVEPLKTFIAKSFSADLVEHHQQAISHVHQAREDVRTIVDKNEHTREQYLRYYGLLQCLEKRFPINEDNIRIQFVWFDAFQRNKKSAQCNLAYEKACVLFNIAALSSQIAEVQNRSNLDGIKKSCHFFQLAAGAFDKLKMYILEHPQQASTTDLSAEFLSMLSVLMLAQAQECFCEKAAKDGMSASIISMLTAQAAEYYELVHTLMNSSTIQPSLEKTWMSHCMLKSAYFKATSNHSAAVALHAKDQYGEEVARLQYAHSLLTNNSLIQELKKMPTEFEEWMNRLREVVAKALAVAERENNSIYHERVPGIGQLLKLPQRSMVKPLELTEAAIPLEKDPFAGLIPFEILQSVSIYNEKKAQLLRAEMQLIKENNDIAKGSLGSMNLPAAIEAVGGEGGPAIPSRLRDRQKTLRGEGGTRHISELVQTLHGLAADAQAIINDAIHILDVEENEDNQIRKQLSNLWTRPPSHALTAALRQEAAKYRSNIEHAQKSDSYVRQKFEEHGPFIDLLVAPEEELAGRLPRDVPNEATWEAVTALRESLGYLDSCIAERNALEAQLKSLAQNDDISAILLSTQHPHEIIYKQELQKYNDIQRKLSNNFEQQKKLMEMISNEHARFLASKTNSEQTRNREALLAALDKAFVAYTELKANLKEGIEFYTSFQDILQAFRAKCKDFAYARNAEKKDLLARQSGAGGQTPGPATTSSPASLVAGYSGHSQLLYQQSPPQHPSYSQQPADAFGVPGSWQPNIRPVYERPREGQGPYSQTQGFPPSPYG